MQKQIVILLIFLVAFSAPAQTKSRAKTGHRPVPAGGKATFEGLAPGKRFLYGEFKAGSNRLSWHMAVDIKAGANSKLILSNDNSLSPTAKDVL